MFPNLFGGSTQINSTGLLDTHYSKLTKNRVPVMPETLDCVLSNISSIPSVIERMNNKLPSNLSTWDYLITQFKAIKKMVDDNFLRDKLKKMLQELNCHAQSGSANWQVNEYLSKDVIAKIRAEMKDTNINSDNADWLLCCISLALLPYIKVTLPFDTERERQTNMLLGVYDLQMSTLPEMLLKLACGKNSHENKLTSFDLAIIKNAYAPCTSYMEKCLLH